MYYKGILQIIVYQQIWNLKQNTLDLHNLPKLEINGKYSKIIKKGFKISVLKIEIKMLRNLCLY